nr:MAG TPA: hypothetical protein [Caudoviricetes sp.]
MPPLCCFHRREKLQPFHIPMDRKSDFERKFFILSHSYGHFFLKWAGKFLSFASPWTKFSKMTRFPSHFY